jgi:CrcB protein
VLIFTGGGCGALLRYFLTLLIDQLAGKSFPYGTLMVNIIGALLIGVLSELILQKYKLGPNWSGLVLIGLLGAFTTFSTFSLEILGLLQNRQFILAGGYVLASVVICLGAAWVGIVLARFF